MSAAEAFRHAEPETKLWRRDWDDMPDEALIRVQHEEQGIYGVRLGFRDSLGEIKGDFGSPWVPVGWYWLPNPNSDAAYGDPGEGLGS